MYDARTENASPIPILNVYQLARPCDRALWPLCRPLAASRPARGQSGSRSRAHVPLCGTIGPVRGCWSVSCSVSVQSVSKNDFTSGAALAGTQRCREPNFVRRAIDEGQRSMQWPTGDHLRALQRTKSVVRDNADAVRMEWLSPAFEFPSPKAPPRPCYSQPHHKSR